MKPYEAIAEFEKRIALIEKYGYVDLAPEFTEAMKMAISALEKQQWIPCSERLPKEDGEYLVTYEKGYAEDYGFEPIGIAPFEVDCEGFGVWQEEFDRYTLGSLGSEWVDIPVTAWMPLPESYKEDNLE